MAVCCRASYGIVWPRIVYIYCFIINIIIRQYVGADGLAAYSAIYSFGGVYWAVPAGVTSSIMVLGSVYAGEEDRTGLKVLMRTFLKNGIALTVIAAFLVSACFYPLTNVFFHDPTASVYKMTMMGFILFPLYAPISSFAVGFSNYYHCMSYEHIVRTISVADGIVAVCLFTFLLTPVMGMNGVWTGQLLGCTFCALLVGMFACIYNKKMPKTLEQMLCFRKDFGVPDENRIDITIHSMDDVINLSEHVWNFCETHGISGRRRNCASLCTEELAGNIVQHGFKDKRKHSIDIRVSYVNEDIIICFKDDGILFNPEEASRLFGKEDSTKGADEEAAHNIGLQLVSRISESMTYQNTFGLNILTIVV